MTNACYPPKGLLPWRGGLVPTRHQDPTLGAREFTTSVLETHGLSAPALLVPLTIDLQPLSIPNLASPSSAGAPHSQAVIIT